MAATYTIAETRGSSELQEEAVWGTGIAWQVEIAIETEGSLRNTSHSLPTLRHRMLQPEQSLKDVSSYEISESNCCKYHAVLPKNLGLPRKNTNKYILKERRRGSCKSYLQVGLFRLETRVSRLLTCLSRQSVVLGY
jgi:hypothetical protein